MGSSPFIRTKPRSTDRGFFLFLTLVLCDKIRQGWNFEVYLVY